ncbi:MAG: hypothetical protein RLZZ162_428, partial [Verrucomicrobiota bacterium]
MMHLLADTGLAATRSASGKWIITASPPTPASAPPKRTAPDAIDARETSLSNPEKSTPTTPMKTTRLPRLLAALLMPLSGGFAQSANPAVTRAADSLIQLNPFKVKADADNSYGALNSNSLTQFNTSLHTTPVSADIFTAEFMRDIGATSIEEMLADYGAGAGAVMSNPGADVLSQQPGDRVGNQTIGIRGTSGGAIRRDGFAATGAANNFGST